MERVKNMKPTHRDRKALGNDSMDSQGRAIEIAPQRSLRLDLTSTDMASAVCALSGASRTQAPSRPRRLRNISAERFLRAVQGNLKDLKIS
jgi:hypothetical protein